MMEFISKNTRPVYSSAYIPLNDHFNKLYHRITYPVVVPKGLLPDSPKLQLAPSTSEDGGI